MCNWLPRAAGSVWSWSVNESAVVPGCFDGNCRQCPRLVAFLDRCRKEHPEYHAAPVAPFGDAAAALLIIGLAPGLHGANRTGRPFTGDHAGILLYETLHELGLASAPQSQSRDDGLRLTGVRISNAVKCVPPANKPETAELRRCNGYLAAELGDPSLSVLLALGRIAHEAVLRALGLRAAAWAFAHGAEHTLPDGRILIDSYHCSRYNTQTRRLTPPMFFAVCARASHLAGVGKVSG
jgi:uracil-DNA glycosylase